VQESEIQSGALHLADVFNRIKRRKSHSIWRTTFIFLSIFSRFGFGIHNAIPLASNRVSQNIFPHFQMGKLNN
jgi:hypothetical protein